MDSEFVLCGCHDAATIDANRLTRDFNLWYTTESREAPVNSTRPAFTLRYPEPCVVVERICDLRAGARGETIGRLNTERGRVDVCDQRDCPSPESVSPRTAGPHIIASQG